MQRMSVLLQKMKVKKVLLSEGNWYFWEKGDLHTDLGSLKELDILKNGKIKSNKNFEFFVFDANFFDKMQRIKRLPQAVMEKDIASILAYSGITKSSIILEAGTGSGKLSSYLAQYCKKVISFDINDEYLKIAKENFNNLKIKNIELDKADIYQKINLKSEVDVFILDVPSPWLALGNIEHLKQGGTFVAYLPTIVQVINLVNESKKFNLKFVKCIENIERSWIIEDPRVRPESKIQFTAFLVFFRKY